MNGTDARAAGVQTSASAAASLAPGFRFHPTDEELVSYYLKRKVAGRPLRVDAIAEVDLYRREPWELPGLSRIRSRDMEWYFFSPLDRKHSNRGRTNRATTEGYWKTTGKGRSVRHGSRVVGMKKTLVFHSGRAPRGVRTNWVMHEYRLGGDDPSEADVPQDAYAVCRIFHKNGAGPQNGAQYGAPFIEEEWENDAADPLAMMNEVDEGDFVDAGEPEYLQHNDFQDQNPEGQHAHPPVLQAGPVGHDGGDNVDDTSAILDKMLREPNLINDIVAFVNESDHPIPIHDFKREPYMEDSSHLVQTDEFIELDDLSDILYARNLFSEDSMNHSLTSFHDENYQDGVGDGSNFENIHRDDGSMNTINQRPDKILESLQIPSVENNIFMNSDGSYQHLEDVNAFYDAPGDDLAFVHGDFVQLNEFYHSPVSEQPAFDVSDDLLAYFDAADVNLQYDLSSIPEEPEIYNSIMTQSNLANEVSGAIVTPGAPSSAYVLANDHFMNKCESFNAESDLQANQGKDLTIAKRLINMLGSIAAPPAYATEIPSITGKCVESFENGSTNSLSVTAEPIHIHGLRVSGNAEHWSLQKNGNMGYFLSYNVKDASRITAGSQPIKKPYGPAVSGVLRGGFCLFFLSAAILGISYKVGLCIYGR